ncbi:MAG TPA: oligosaccharide flippase family protein [Acidothermaceae bacterium]
MPTGSTAATESPAGTAELAAWERSKIGDRLGSFGVLLPARPAGPVVLAVDAGIADVLRRRYAHVLVLSRSIGSGLLVRPPAYVLWDGRHNPVMTGSAALVVIDSRLGSVASLRPALAPGGTLAVLGGRGEFVIYPSARHPEQVWRRDWPLPHLSGFRAQVRRLVGLHTSRRRGAPRLFLEGKPGPSIADLVLADLAASTGRPGRLVGVETAGHTILRVRRSDGDIAVRLALSNTEQQPTVGGHVAAEVPSIRPLVQKELARGTTVGCPWVATRWLPRGRRPLVDLLWGERRRWQIAETLVAGLSTVCTGRSELGWAKSWCDRALLAPRDIRERLAGVMAPLDDGVPLGWCHGDPWPPNVVIDRNAAAVIDWENATSDAPLGLDWLLLEVLREVRAGRGSVAAVCKRMIDGKLSTDRPVGGRPFGEWDVPRRTAFVVATFMLYLRNRSLHDLGADNLRAELSLITAALEPTTNDDAPGQQPPTPPKTGRVARGAGWLGLSAAVVKGAQTAVLLVLASLLAPSALGLIAIGTMITNVSQVISDLGTNTALIYWRGDARRAARSAVTLSATLNVLIAGLVWLVAPWLANALHAGPDGAWVIRGLVSVLPCYGVAATSLELLRRDLAFVRRVIPDIAAALCGATVAVVLAVQGHGVAALVAGQIVQGVLTLVLAWIAGGVIRPGWRIGDVRGLLGYGAHLTGANLLQLVVFNVDYVIVARVLGPTSLGQYSLAFRLAFLPYLNVAFVIAGAAFPYLCRLGDGAVGPAVARVVAAAMRVLVPLCLGIALFADQLQLLGTKWQPAIAAARWLALYATLLSVAQFAQTALNSIGRPRNTLQLQLLHLVILVAALVALARYGITAVAIGQVLAASVESAAALAIARQHLSGFRVGELAAALTPVGVGAVCMAVVVLGFQAAFPGTRVSIEGLLVVGALGVAAYLGALGLLDRKNLVRTVVTMARPS